MSRTLAIARLTFWEGIRMRIVLVFVIVLIFVVLRLPFALRGDETLTGRLQTFLEYSLRALSVCLGLATIFLSCATLTRDIQERSIHLVVTKPVSRFQILTGKWLGVNLLNVLLLLLSGLVIYGFALFIKSRPEPFARDRLKLDDTVWTARAAARPVEPDFNKLARENVEEMAAQGQTFPEGKEAKIAALAKDMKEDFRRIPPGNARLYEFEGLDIPDGSARVYQVQYKAQSIPYTGNLMLYIDWVIVHPENQSNVEVLQKEGKSDLRHEFLVTTGVVKDGKALLGVGNPPQNKHKTIYFEGDDAIEILYKVGSFEMNFVKSLLLILFRLAFLSALGLFFGTFVSFPVACFCVLFILGLCIAQPFWLESIGANVKVLNAQTDPYHGLLGRVLDRLVVAVGLFVLGIICWRLGFIAPTSLWIGGLALLVLLEVLNLDMGFYSGRLIRALLEFIMQYALPNFDTYDGIPKLISGYVVRTKVLLGGAAYMLGYGILLLALPGWLIFRQREIAEATA